MYIYIYIYIIYIYTYPFFICLFALLTFRIIVFLFLKTSAYIIIYDQICSCIQLCTLNVIETPKKTTYSLKYTFGIYCYFSKIHLLQKLDIQKTRNLMLILMMLLMFLSVSTTLIVRGHSLV